MKQEQGDPWDRLQGEPEHWFARFEMYRLAGPTRTVEASYRSEARDKAKRYLPTNWKRAVERWHWKERAEAWDDDERERARKQRLVDIESANQRHVGLAREAFGLVKRRIQTLEVKDFSTRELIRLAEFAIKQEREGLAESAIVELQETVQGVVAQVMHGQSGTKNQRNSDTDKANRKNRRCSGPYSL
jgi:hypothetical protein